MCVFMPTINKDLIVEVRIVFIRSYILFWQLLKCASDLTFVQMFSSESAQRL